MAQRLCELFWLKIIFDDLKIKEKQVHNYHLLPTHFFSLYNQAYLDYICIGMATGSGTGLTILPSSLK